MSLKAIDELSEMLTLLPSVGRKSAERMAYQLLEMDSEILESLGEKIKSLNKEISICPICGAYKEETCIFCDDKLRDQDTLIVVTSYKDALAFEKLKSYHGLYHILGGSLSPSKGVGAKDIRISSLISRIENNNIQEIILATDTTLDGETTALYIGKLLENHNCKVTRIAHGLPMGGHLTYADELTLMSSLEGRKSLK